MADSLSTPSTAVETVRRYFETHTKLSPDEVLNFYTEDAHYQFGNAPAVDGRQAIVASAKASHLEQILDTAFDIKRLWDLGDTIVCELEVIITRRDGKIVRFPCCDTIRLQGDKFQDLRIYIDPSPLFA